MKLNSYIDAIPRATPTLALYTDGANLKINLGAVSESGRWSLAENRSFLKVLIYRKTDTGGDIYVGDFVRKIKRPRTDEFSYVQFSNTKLVGRTTVKWTEFTDQPNSRSQRVYLPRPSAVWIDPSEEKDYFEGATTSVVVNKYERDPKARKACIDHFGAKCRVCDMTFKEKYGAKLGGEFIHVHHVVPLSSIKKTYKVNPLKDLVPVCPNCHAMLHNGNLGPDELRRHLKK
ncbi:MAG: HNH endonuclease [Polaromonas sp.]|uniref:HNH endonuclease n=1 Tax=Polaromonas sp. TaxID=1869339 RepID=UPI0024878952|nr:HNH endonuclease [Polaromonas sp.]MDI1238648.1 HNH endonuclease [Polaromonas sp.]